MIRTKSSITWGILLLLVCGADSSAQTFYVDGANPASSDSNPGSEAEPYRTIAGAMAAHYGSGVTILVKPAMYDEWINVVRSGGPDQFVIRALGSGAEVRGAGVSGRFMITIDGFTIRGGVALGGARNVHLTNNHIIASSTNKAIYATGCDGLQIIGNTISDSGYDGIVFRDVHTSLIEDNDICRSVNKGLVLNALNDGTIGIIIRRNRFYENGASAICFDIRAHDSVTIQNLMWDNQHGLEHRASFSNRHLGDVIWGNRNDGVWIKDGVTDLTIANCIIAENGTGNSSSYHVYIDSLSVVPEMNDNVYSFSSGQPLFKHGSQAYATLAAWTSATGQDTRSFNEPPRFRDPENQDFHLTQRSPAVDCANTNLDGWPETDTDGLGPLDDPRIANTGIGAITYADRGAFEFVPSTLAVGDNVAASERSLTMSPNPMRATGQIEYVLGRREIVRLTVVDLQGRTIATLEQGSRAAGRHSAIWNGHGVRGRAQSGVYFLRLETSERRLAKRFALVR